LSSETWRFFVTLAAETPVLLGACDIPPIVVFWPRDWLLPPATLVDTDEA